MFIEPLPISRTKNSAKGSIRAEKVHFPREIGPPRRKRFLRPLEFPKKTRRGPEGSIRENREIAEKTPTGDMLEMGLFSLRVLSDFHSPRSEGANGNDSALTASIRGTPPTQCDSHQFGKKSLAKKDVFPEKSRIFEGPFPKNLGKRLDICFGKSRGASKNPAKTALFRQVEIR
jgi:hypothetical protein